MTKYELLSEVLGADVTMKAGFFGGKNFASFSEEQLEKIENALKETDTTQLQDELNQANEENTTLKNEKGNIVEAVMNAFQLNSFAATEDVVKNIEILGTTCKEYGDKKNVHTPLTTDGKEVDLEENTLKDGFFDPKDEHNKI